MPAKYVDNAQNRKLGRAGMPRGSAAVAGGATAGGGHMSNVLTHRAKTYVDNVDNRRLGRTGMPIGSMPVSKDTPANVYNVSPHSAKTYVDNADNRRRGRTGMPIGSMPVSRDTNIPDNVYKVSTHSAKTYVDNADNRRLGRTGMPIGSMPVSRDTPANVYNVSPHSAKTYVDNADNRRRGRTGMPIGSMPVSRDTNIPDNVYEVSTHSAKTYVDNTDNRRRGRVGMSIGSVPVSKGTPDNVCDVSTHSAKTYVDNADNRRLGRVRMPIGSMPVSKGTPDHVCDASTHSAKTHVDDLNASAVQGAKAKVYVDSPSNRKLGRVGMPHGEAVIYKNGHDNSELATQTRVYKDNPLNRRLGRVGLPIGAAVFSSKTRSVVAKTYDNTRNNRMLGRVGLHRGSLPVQKKSPATKNIPEMLKRIENGDEFKEFVFEDRGSRSEYGLKHDDEAVVEAFDQAMYQINRQQEEIAWQDNLHEQPKTMVSVLKDYQGKQIAFSDIKLHKKIGRGGFGEVYFAKWNETVVAVKKLQKEKISNTRILDFADEVMKFCTLDHPNIVKFIGACVETLNICIVMEYMQMSLYDAIHIRKYITFTEQERIGIIEQICEGMKYLHSKRISHCDLKPPNILLDYIEDHIYKVKITDFGLSMIKRNDTLSSSSMTELVHNIGTPRYSSPEMLRGEYLSAKDMMTADVYALGLIVLEIIFEIEPFPDFTYQELIKRVGYEGLVPDVPQAPAIEKCVLEIMQMAWSYDPSKRPNVARIRDVFRSRQNIYTHQDCHSYNYFD